MSFKGIILFAFALSFGPVFAAVTLPPLTTTAPPTVPAPPTAALTCDQVAAAIAAYGKAVGTNNDGVTSFIDNISSQVTNWYTLLQPLEGTTQQIATGTFSPLQDGATQISNIEDLNAQNSAYLAKQFAAITKALATCTIASK